ncbi:MAG: hypothetical protein U1C18_02195 [Patescibacteria group bacterium]|nr:hypothetical protein [Patescibacteria group bacterium]
MSNSNQIALLKQMIERAQKQIETASSMLSKVQSGEDVDISSLTSQASRRPQASQEEGEVVEGVFDGVQMHGNDGKSYSVPPNYASKSKLCEGDILKLTILSDGSFLYKQIGPVERKRVRGTLMQDEDTGEYTVLAGGTSYKVLSASITYFKGEVGDEIVILVPSDTPSHWAAVENIIKQIAAHASEPADSGYAATPRETEPQDALDKATADLL